MVDTATISNASWLALPQFQAPVYDTNAILIIAPACIVVLAEHISHLIVTSNITGEDLMKKPGLHRSLLGDGISNVISGFTGSRQIQLMAKTLELWLLHASTRFG